MTVDMGWEASGRQRPHALIAAPRDLVGYGDHPPDPAWPKGGRIALQFVINFEEGGERSVLNGDLCSEAAGGEEPTWERMGHRNLNVESQFEYGTRAGFWRLYRMFQERGLPVTVFGVATSLIQNPQAVAAMKSADWEIACHGFRWMDYTEVAEGEERRHIEAAIALHSQATGAAPVGWYSGRPSAQTRRLVMNAGNVQYDADSFADDLPYWVLVDGRCQLVVPYTLDNNDGRYVSGYGFQAASFSAYLRRSFDCLYREGKESPKMMSVGLHNRITGRPGRAEDFMVFLDYISTIEDCWVTRRIDIAEHWRDHFPPPTN